MESHHAHQPILPPDKRDPCFSLDASEDERFIHVFNGLELFEVVADDREHMSFQMMIGRLYNAGVKVTALEDSLNPVRKLTQNYGVLRWTGAELAVHLVVRVNSPPKL